jgi:hypothetical protein
MTAWVLRITGRRSGPLRTGKEGNAGHGRSSQNASKADAILEASVRFHTVEFPE